MALPIINNWRTYFDNVHEGLGSSYERIILNELLLDLKNKYDITSVIEVPIFGFTGVTGLNSVSLYKSGCNVTLIDSDDERINKVKAILEQINAEISIMGIQSFHALPFKNDAFDMSWNFSALWFVEDLSKFLIELARITKKIILICVPNQSGIGYKWQKANSDIPKDIVFNEEYINPELIKNTFQNIGWQFIRESYIDCPPWPDIGMTKEKFFGKLFNNTKIPSNCSKPSKIVSIIDYYQGNNNDFKKEMLRYSFVERYAPIWFKKLWAHHRWMLFESNKIK